jgi:hypothetical protein
VPATINSKLILVAIKKGKSGLRMKVMRGVIVPRGGSGAQERHGHRKPRGQLIQISGSLKHRVTERPYRAIHRPGTYKGWCSFSVPCQSVGAISMLPIRQSPTWKTM